MKAYHRRAGSRFNAGKVKDSLPDFDVAARLDPKNAEICKNRAFAYLKLVRLEDAVADLRHAQERDPDHMAFSCRVDGEPGLRFGILPERCIQGASKLKKAGFPGENRRLDVVMGEIDR